MMHLTEMALAAFGDATPVAPPPPPPRVALFSNADNSGGAARAAYRLYRALHQAGADADMIVCKKFTDDWRVTGPASALGKAVNFFRPKLGAALMARQKSANCNLHSANVLPSGRAAQLAASGATVVNLHWLGGESMSITDIGRITQPVVWTLHDMWAFCGAEHVCDDGPAARWRSGYRRDNRPSGASGVDLDWHTWQRKRAAWRTPMHIVTPSRWLAACVRDSALMRGWPLSVIPNVLDTDVFKPLGRRFSRHALNLPQERKIVLFGALGGGRDFVKGYDLLLAALQHLRVQRDDFECVVFGESQPKNGAALPFPTRWMGHVGDDATLALLYSAADLTVIPSRCENLTQCGTEAQACACPMVAFDCSGLPDVVAHQHTGYLAAPFDPQALAQGIGWVLADSARRHGLGLAARARAVAQWSPAVVVPQYLDLYAALAHGSAATLATLVRRYRS